MVCMIYIGNPHQFNVKKLYFKHILLSQTSWLPSKKESITWGSIISSPEPKALGELIGWDSSRRSLVCPFTLSDINISKTGWPIIIKFHLKYHWGGGLAELGFGPDLIRTLVSMATDSSHRVIMGKIL